MEVNKGLPAFGAEEEGAVEGVGTGHHRLGSSTSALSTLSTGGRSGQGGQSGSIRAYNQNGFPVFVLVDPDGIIKDIHLGHYDGLLHKLTDDIKAAHPLT